VAVDDHTRLADVEVLPHQRGLACRAFLERAIAWCRALCHVPGAPRALRPWVRYYNRERPHASLGYQPPLTRLRSAV
jgi:transposase InsO family protein